MTSTKRIAVLTVGMLLTAPVTATAREWVECGSTNPRHASCPDPAGGSSCTFTDATGIVRTGSVRICPPCTDGSGRDLGLSGAYCFVPGIAPPQLCSGGDLILHEGAVVGCLFDRFTGSERSQCEERRIVYPVRPYGKCWVCIEKGKASLVTDDDSWQELDLSDGTGAIRAGDFSCLGKVLIERRDGYPVANHPTMVRPDLEGALEAACRGRWTPWLNRDTPGGSGDFETLEDFLQAGEACARPSAVECRTRDGVAWDRTGETVHCDLASGGRCVNGEQRDGGRCSDYEVRFCC